MNHDDAALVGRVLAGDKPAFGLLIDRYRGEAQGLARRMLGDVFDAEDVTQEALLQAFLGLSALRSFDRFHSWLLGIVVNLCKIRLRTKRDWHPADEWHGGRVPNDFTFADLQPSPEAIYEARELHEIVLAAIRTLPRDQQTVRMYYVDGLSLWDIGRLAGVPVSTVKVRLHRARARLRLDLKREFEMRDATMRTIQETPMIEVMVHDVMLRAPKGDNEAEWLPGRKKKYKLGFDRVILLKEQAGNRILPIWVGAVEGDAIAMLLEGLSTSRPGTFELTAKLLDVAKMKIEKVVVTALREDIYYATMWVKTHGKIHEVDARPSDAITLSLRAKAPIFVLPEVLESNQYLVTTNAIISGLDTIHRKVVEENRTLPEAVAMEWRSFRSLPRGGGRWLSRRSLDNIENPWKKTGRVRDASPLSRRTR